jgi:hypothetical protein
MNLRFITLALAAAALVAPAATADPGHGKAGHDPAACHGKANVRVLLKGTLANDPAAADTSFQLTVQRANRWGRPYMKAAQPLSVNVDANTRYTKADQPATLDSLALNDQVVVMAKASRCDLRKAGSDPTALPALTAKRVVVQAQEQEAPSSP